MANVSVEGCLVQCCLHGRPAERLKAALIEGRTFSAPARPLGCHVTEPHPISPPCSDFEVPGVLAVELGLFVHRQQHGVQGLDAGAESIPARVLWFRTPALRVCLVVAFFVPVSADYRRPELLVARAQPVYHRKQVISSSSIFGYRCWHSGIAPRSGRRSPFALYSRCHGGVR
jgi:hypothetical protein